MDSAGMFICLCERNFASNSFSSQITCSCRNGFTRSGNEPSRIDRFRSSTSSWFIQCSTIRIPSELSFKSSARCRETHGLSSYVIIYSCLIQLFCVCVCVCFLRYDNKRILWNKQCLSNSIGLSINRRTLFAKPGVCILLMCDFFAIVFPGWFLSDWSISFQSNVAVIFHH